ncbi:MAG: IclR family transcriptional regulator C-terminal domain-containing protein [Betaproteobacteria bacterium]
MTVKPKPIRTAVRARPRPKPARAAARGRNGGAGHTQALSRGLAVLEALATTETGATLTALAERLALPAPTAHRLLATLAEAGYVEQGPGGEWMVGVRAFRVGSAFLDHRNLVAQAYPFLKRLMEQSGETTNLAVIDDGEAVTVEQVPCRELMRMSTKLGARAPLHASGVGKAMLAAMDDATAATALARHGLARRTARTITTRERLAAELAATRERGYAVDDEEHAAGMRCVAAAIWDEHGEPWAAISLAGPTSRLTSERVADLGRLVRSTAADMTTALGGKPPRR